MFFRPPSSGIRRPVLPPCSTPHCFWPLTDIRRGWRMASSRRILPGADIADKFLVAAFAPFHREQALLARLWVNQDRFFARRGYFAKSSLSTKSTNFIEFTAGG